MIEHVEIEQGCLAVPKAILGAAVSIFSFWAGLAIGLLLFQAPLWTRAMDQSRAKHRIKYVVANQTLYLIVYVVAWSILAIRQYSIAG